MAAVGVAAQTVANDAKLNEVTVSDQAEAIGNLQKTYSGGQLARGGSLGILGTTDLMNVPFSTTNYTAELIQNQQALTVADVVMNDASVRPLTSRGGFGDDFQVRGFTVPNNDIGFNGLYGLTSTTRVPLEAVERVEVLKGPGSFANGMSPTASIGGSINVVPKRAGDIPLTRLTGTYMGQAQFGTHLDVGRRFGEDNQWGVRVNGVWRNGEGNIDGGRQRLGMASLGLDYAGTGLRWSFDALSSRGKTNEFRPQISFATGVTQAIKPPSPRSNWYPGTQLEDDVDTLATRLEYDINDRTTVYAGVGYSEVDNQQIFPSARPGLDAAGNFTVRNGYYDFYSKTTAADAGVRTRFDTGSIKHTLALGVNLLDQESGFFYAQSPAPGSGSNIYNPSPLPANTIARGKPTKSGELAQHSVALVDTMAFFNDQFLLTLGVRDQTIEQKSATGATTYKKSAVSPLAGLVFKATKNISVYTNYTAGLIRGGTAPAGTANPVGQAFPPQKSKQYEVGVKADWGRLMTQVAIYEITRPRAFTDQVTNVYSFGGEQRNRGLELTAYGEVQRGLRVMASAAFNDAKLTRTAGGTNQGNDAAGVPDRTFNLGLDWDTPWVPGLSLNGRVIHTSQVYATEANDLRMPSWTRLDLGARYATKISGKPVTLRANLENVFNRDYWITSTYVTVGAPRTLMLSASVDF